MNKTEKNVLKVLMILTIILVINFVSIKSLAVMRPEPRIRLNDVDLLDSLPKSIEKNLDDFDLNDFGQALWGEDLKEDLDSWYQNIEETLTDSVFIASFIGLFVIILIVLGLKFICAIIKFIAKWMMYNKAGKPGWALLLPVYKNVIKLEIADLSPALLLLYFTFFIPFIGPIICIIAFFVIRIIAAVNISKAFGKHGAFSIGLIFLPTIFYAILGFGKSEYKKEEKVKETVAEVKVIEAEVEAVKKESKIETKVASKSAKQTTEKTKAKKNPPTTKKTNTTKKGKPTTKK